MAELPDGVRALLGRANFAHVATVLPSGAPHTVPVWIALEGDRIAFFTQPGSRKARNLEADPRVAISIVDHERPYKMAQIRGRVVETVGGTRRWRSWTGCRCATRASRSRCEPASRCWSSPRGCSSSSCRSSTRRLSLDPPILASTRHPR